MLTFVGLGLWDELGITLRGLEKAKHADKVYVEFYTNVMPKLKLDRIEGIIGKQVVPLTRSDVEEHPEKTVLKDAENQSIVLLVPGDSMVATTHIDLRLRAWKRHIPTQVIPGVSIFSAIVSATGLQSYKFGRTVTVPFPSETYKPDTPYRVVTENTRMGLHSLVLLDIDAQRERYMTVQEGLSYLLEWEEKLRKETITSNRLAVGMARLGGDDALVRADVISKLLEVDFGAPPHTLALPGELHFMETEALKAFASAPDDGVKMGERKNT